MVKSWGDLDGHTGQIATVVGANVFFLERFTMVERMGQPFTLTCEVACQDLVDLSPYLGSAVLVTLKGDALVGRPFHGMLAEASAIEITDDVVRYLLVVRPWFWFLSLGKNSRIFQNQTTMAIIKKVFNEAGISADAFSDKTQSAGKESRNYCVQYDESDFAFVSRLMEEEGIYYYFVHTASAHVMTLCDGPACHEAAFKTSIPLNRDTPGKWIEPRVWTWGAHVRPTPTRVTMRDFHMKTFGNAFAGRKDTTAGEVAPELYYYPGGYSHLSDDGSQSGEAYSAVRLDAARAERTLYTGEGDAFAVPVGGFLTIAPVAGHPMEEQMDVLVCT